MVCFKSAFHTIKRSSRKQHSPGIHPKSGFYWRFPPSHPLIGSKKGKWAIQGRKDDGNGESPVRLFIGVHRPSLAHIFCPFHIWNLTTKKLPWAEILSFHACFSHSLWSPLSRQSVFQQAVVVADVVVLPVVEAVVVRDQGFRRHFLTYFAGCISSCGCGRKKREVLYLVNIFYNSGCDATLQKLRSALSADRMAWIDEWGFFS